MIKTVMIVLVSLLLAACKSETVYRYVALTPDEQLITTHAVPPPPISPEEYSMSACTVRESLLIEYISQLMIVIGKEQSDKVALRYWKENVLMMTGSENQDD